ncbi:MAG: hypothetical protein WB495_27100 [Xanthobacteraceae bacterium]
MDATRSKRAILALGVLVVALSAIVIEFRPTFPLVLIGLTLQGVTGGILGPAIAAISLGLVGHMALPEWLGRNQRFAATGSLAAAALMGLTGYIFSYQAIFQRWSRFPEQNGGLAKVDSGLGYAANFSWVAWVV